MSGRYGKASTFCSVCGVETLGASLCYLHNRSHDDEEAKKQIEDYNTHCCWLLALFEKYNPKCAWEARFDPASDGAELRQMGLQALSHAYTFFRLNGCSNERAMLLVETLAPKIVGPLA